MVLMKLIAVRQLLTEILRPDDNNHLMPQQDHILDESSQLGLCIFGPGLFPLSNPVNENKIVISNG